MAKERISQSELDGVQYRRAKLWQIILVTCNALNGMAIYTLIGQASYAASIGFGISTLIIGGLLTFTRIFDAITDPLLAFLYDRVNTRWGKIRPLMLLGWAVQSLGIMAMFSWAASKGFGIGMFLATYMLYVIGYTIVNMTAQTLPALLTNDPKQRPTVGVWQTVFNYIVPMAFTIILNTVLLPKYGQISVTETGYAVNYSQSYLTAAAIVTVVTSLVGVLLVCIGISAYDKPENFRGTNKAHERLSWKDMWSVLKDNKPLQAYIISASSDKIAQQAGAAAVVSTMLSGILIGNMTIATYLSVGGMLPSIIFAIIGAKYCGKHGNKEAIVNWAKYCIFANLGIIAFFTVVWFSKAGTTSIAHFGITMILYIMLTLVCNGFMMAGTTANTAFMADIIDYELDRSGKYIPAVVSGTYSLIDKIVSSFSALIATAGVALIGYTSTLPQPSDKPTLGIFTVTMALRYGLAILGWLCTLWAMRKCKLGKAEMVEVQKRIEEKKNELKHELIEEELHKGDPANA